jgi:hypothetical protein
MDYAGSEQQGRRGGWWLGVHKRVATPAVHKAQQSGAIPSLERYLELAGQAVAAAQARGRGPW